jgi:TetR/AcrR family transcriptional regulator, transcriptional repressor for nem operon
MYGHIRAMPKPSNRERILASGLKVVHERGFAGASVRDIVHAAGVPQGSFTNHFASKEAFGLEILERYFAESRATIRATLRNDALAPLDRLGAWLDANRERLKRNGMRCGCLFGNLTAETSEHSEIIRRRLLEIFAEVQHAIAYCLAAAATAGELPAEMDCEAMAGFIVSSLQGANLLAKAERSLAPVERFKEVLFAQILR